MLSSPRGTSPQLAALGTNPSCGTVGIVPAALRVRGNSSDLCPRALLGIPAEQGLWKFTDSNELLLLHWNKSTSLQWLIITSFWFFTPPKDVTVHILANMRSSVAFPGSGGNTLPQALGQTGKIGNSWARSYCIAFRSTSANPHPQPAGQKQGHDDCQEIQTSNTLSPSSPKLVIP